MDIIKIANNILNECNKGYFIKIGSLNKLIEKDCHTGVFQKNKNEFILQIYSKYPEEILGYISFNVYPGVIHLMYSCAKLDYRRKKLILILRVLIIEIAIRLKIKFITSYTNNISNRLLGMYNAKEIDLENTPKEVDKLLDYFAKSSQNIDFGGINTIINLKDPETIRIHKSLLNEIQNCILPIN